MPYTMKDFRRDFTKAHLHLLTLDERLEGVTSAEILKRLTPEERLKGLTPEEILAALTPKQIEQLRELLNVKRKANLPKKGVRTQTAVSARKLCRRVEKAEGLTLRWRRRLRRDPA